MRILGYIHTFNDAEVIDRSLQALLDQTCPVEEIVLVDNASTDGTLTRSFPKQVAVIRNPENRGTSGAIIRGMQYALAKQYDWIWVLDADSTPCKDALEKLVELYQSFPPNLQEHVWRLSSLLIEFPKFAITTPFSLRLAKFGGSQGPQPRHGTIFTPRGYIRVKPIPNEDVYEFNGSIWSGSLFKLEAVAKIGFPSADYFLDFDEYAYGYRAMRHGYRAFMHQGSIVNQNVTGEASLELRTYQIGPLSFKMIELPPIRCYYVIRNTLYFWLYEYHIHNMYTLLPRFYKITMLTLNFLLRPFSHRSHLKACLRGIWDGLLKNMHHRY